jgi:protein CMS1
MSNEDNLQEPLLEDSTLPQLESANTTNTTSKKRKRTKAQGQEESKNKESAKRKKPKPSEDEDIDFEAGLNHAIAKMDNHLLADYIARQTRRYESDLSSVELEDKYLPGELYLALLSLSPVNHRAFSHCYTRYYILE